MHTTIEHEKVAGSINEWYVAIKKQLHLRAKELKQKVDATIHSMEENEPVLAYYTLVDHRHKLMLNHPQLRGMDSLENSLIQDRTDEMLQYYFFFFSGIHAFYKRKYVEAIRFYKIAENYLRNIPDEIENAEFHYQVGIAYYQIGQYFFSLDHASKAYESFHSDDNYINRTIASKLLIAMNKTELLQFVKAERYYEEALELANVHEADVMKEYIYQNMSLYYVRCNMFHEAEIYLKRVLDIRENNLVALLELFVIYHKCNEKEEANILYEQGINFAKDIDEGFIHKFKLIQALFNDKDLEKVNFFLEKLEEQNLWGDIEWITLVAIEFLENTGDNVKALQYFHSHMEARKKVLTTTEES